MALTSSRTRMPSGLRPRRVAVLLAAAMLAGCAAQREHSEGLRLLEQDRPLEAVESLRRASTMEPDNVRYRIDYLDKRAQAVRREVDAADSERAAGRLDTAMKHYRNAEAMEPTNARVIAGIHAVESERRATAALQAADRQLQANQTEQAMEQVRRALKEIPQHPRALELQRTLEQRIEAERTAREEQLAARAAFKRPLTLQFRDAPLRMVFDAISRLGNVNLVIDRDVKSELRTTIYVRDASIEDALDVILLQNQLEKRQLNGNTLLIYPASTAKQKELAELKVRSFQLSNVDVGFMANIIKTMIKTKDVVTDVKTNTLVMRDTPDAIALAERLVAANDLPDAEVMLEVEVLEISSSRASEIGLKLPSSFTVSTPAPSTGSSLTVGDLRALTRNSLQVSGLSATLNLMLQDGDTNILASPRIRSRNREKARILVGDKLPVITNLISPQQAGQNSVITGSIQYVDVGIKLEVEPQVYADGDVGIKLNLEVSNVSDTIQTESGRAYQIGTRSAQSTLRLHDGETQVMAGLINDTDRNAAQKVPGLGQMPVLGRLFSNYAGDNKKSEIVLSITPRIIRPQAVADPRYADAWSGTETSVRDRPLRIEPLAALKTQQAGTAAGQHAGVAPAHTPAPVPLPTPKAAAVAADEPAETPPATPAGTAPSAGPSLVAPRALPGRIPMAVPAVAPKPPSPAASAAEGAGTPAPADKP